MNSAVIHSFDLPLTLSIFFCNILWDCYAFEWRYLLLIDWICFVIFRYDFEKKERGCNVVEIILNLFIFIRRDLFFSQCAYWRSIILIWEKNIKWWWYENLEIEENVGILLFQVLLPPPSSSLPKWRKKWVLIYILTSMFWRFGSRKMWKMWKRRTFNTQKRQLH